MVRLFTALQNQGQASPLAGVADAFKSHEEQLRQDEALRQQGQQLEHSIEMDGVNAELAKESLKIKREALTETIRANQAKEAATGIKTATATQAAEDNLAIAMEANERGVAALQSRVLSLGAAMRPNAQDLKDWAVPLREALETVRTATPETFAVAQKAFEAAMAQAQLNVTNAIPVRAVESATENRDSAAEMFGEGGKYEHLNIPERELNAIITNTTDVDELAEQKKELETLANDYGDFRAYEDIIAQAQGHFDKKGIRQGGDPEMPQWDPLWKGFKAWGETKGTNDAISYTQKEFINNASIWNDAQKPIAERNLAAQNMIGYASAKGPQGEVISNQGRTIDRMEKEKEVNATAARAMRSLSRGVSGVEFTLGGDKSDFLLDYIAEGGDETDEEGNPRGGALSGMPEFHAKMKETAALLSRSSAAVEKDAIGEQAAEQRWAHIQREADEKGIDLEEFGAYIKEVFSDPDFQAALALSDAQQQLELNKLRRGKDYEDTFTGGGTGGAFPVGA